MLIYGSFPSESCFFANSSLLRSGEPLLLSNQAQRLKRSASSAAPQGIIQRARVRARSRRACPEVKPKESLGFNSHQAASRHSHEYVRLSLVLTRKNSSKQRLSWPQSPLATDHWQLATAFRPKLARGDLGPWRAAPTGLLSLNF